MKPPARTTSVKSDQSTPPSDRKRKRHTSHSTSTEAKQRTLQSLFSGQTKRLDTEPATPENKRFQAKDRPGSSASSPSKALSTGEMYTFASRSPVANGNSVVDLTGDSSPNSLGARKVNGNARPRPGLGAQIGARKLVVKNLKQNNTWDSKSYLEKIWAQLDEALTVIFADQQELFSKEDLYRGVENVCRQGGASSLYSRLEGRCQMHAEQDMRRKLLQTKGTDDVSLLRQVLSEWATWKAQMVTIRAIFFFLDRSYLLPSKKPNLAELTPLLFRDTVFKDSQLLSRTIDGACDLVASDRSRSGLDESLLSQAVDMFHELSVYSSSFEPRFLDLTKQYISGYSNELISEKTVPEYVLMADEILAREMSRCERFALDTSTQRDLLALLEDHLVLYKEPDLVAFDPLKMLLDRPEATNELASLYALLKRRRLGSNLRPAFEKWIDEVGTSIVLADETDDMIVRLLSLKRRLDFIWLKAFQRDESLGHGLRETFDVFINKTKKGQSTWGTDNTKVGEMIAKYVDQLLRGGAKAIPDDLTLKKSTSITGPAPTTVSAPAADEENEDPDMDEDEEVNIQLDQVLDLFRFLHGKAVFEAFYKKDLARRLLMGRSASADAERSMLTRLKTECGSQFTLNLEQMFKDVELAREEMQSYKQRLEDRIGYEKGKNVDLSVNILSAAAWPSYPDVPVNVPRNIQKAIEDFELHYKSKHSGRKLAWKHALAHCQVRATFNNGSKELVVSSFQAIVLLLFNGLAESDHLSYEHLRNETGLPEAEIKRTLQSLACAKLQPLTKHPKGKEIKDTDTFTVNGNFKHPKYRVKINQVQLKETKEENRATHERVQEDRNFETQAAVVRILKSRKTISHPELISEVIKATMSRGRLEVRDIKKNIDRLIEKDYMEREEGNMYSYIA